MARLGWGGVVVACVVAAAGCSKDAPEPAPRAGDSKQPSVEASRPALPVADALLVGVVHEDGQHVCTANHQESWINKFRQVGFVRAVASPEVDAELVTHKGKPVVAHGRVTDRIPAGAEPAPADVGECPAYQMRSDWVLTAEGMRMQRGASPGIPAFEVARVEPFAGLRAEVVDAGLNIELTNTLGVALSPPVEVVVHYEGCYGKPGSEQRSLVADTGLAAGAKLAGTLPLITEADRVPGNPQGTRDHRAYSIEIRAKGAGVYFDFDVSLSTLGVDAKCPEN